MYLQEHGLINGSRGIIKKCEEDGVYVLFKNGQYVKIDFNEYNYTDTHYKIYRYQLPLLLAWSITIHKAQGCSLDYAIMDLGPSIFDFGQSYVSLSRVRSLEGLYLIQFSPNKIKVHPKVIEFEEQLKNS